VASGQVIKLHQPRPAKGSASRQVIGSVLGFINGLEPDDFPSAFGVGKHAATIPEELANRCHGVAANPTRTIRKINETPDSSGGLGSSSTYQEL